MPVPLYALSKRPPGTVGFDPFHLAGINRAHDLAVGARKSRFATLPEPALAWSVTRLL